MDILLGPPGQTNLLKIITPSCPCRSECGSFFTRKYYVKAMYSRCKSFLICLTSFWHKVVYVIYDCLMLFWQTYLYSGFLTYIITTHFVLNLNGSYNFFAFAQLFWTLFKIAYNILWWNVFFFFSLKIPVFKPTWMLIYFTIHVYLYTVWVFKCWTLITDFLSSDDEQSKCQLEEGQENTFAWCWVSRKNNNHRHLVSYFLNPWLGFIPFKICQHRSHSGSSFQCPTVLYYYDLVLFDFQNSIFLHLICCGALQ